MAGSETILKEKAVVNRMLWIFGLIFVVIKTCEEKELITDISLE